MIALNNGHQTGTTCPKCENQSVFGEKIYKWFGHVYMYTQYKCEMSGCDWMDKTEERDYKIERILR